MSSAVARRYAQALVDLCDERGDHVAVRDAFDRLAAVLAEVPEAREFIANPVIKEGDRAKVLDDLLAKTKAGDTVGRFAKLLLQKGRFDAIAAIHQTFSTELDSRTGRLSAHVTSAIALDKVTLGRIEKALAGARGRDVQLESNVDEALIGGLIIRVGNTVYDGSVRNHLDRLRDKMLAGTGA